MQDMAGEERSSWNALRLSSLAQGDITTALLIQITTINEN